MINNRRTFFAIILIITGGILLFSMPRIVSAAQLTLGWGANDPAPEGYRLYKRVSGEGYNYADPIWSGTGNTCTINGLTEGVMYYFVVRAFQGGDQSGDSNEVQFQSGGAAPAPITILSPDVDSDGDGWNDALDAFAQNPTEWLDTDQDGLGDNADTDDDNDGMPDIWEIQYGLNPLVNDAREDLDGDGISNEEEFNLHSDPSRIPGNTAPEPPLPDQPVNGMVGVALTPTLRTQAFSDMDGDSHARTCLQISTDADFSSPTALVFDKTYSQHLTSLNVPELILDPETIYYWRVRFIDQHNEASEWSSIFSFETISYSEAGDENHNSIVDALELDGGSDLDEDGTADRIQAGLQGVVTGDAFNPRIAVKRVSLNAQVGGVQPLNSANLSEAPNHPQHLTGVIGFKLYLLSDPAFATVTVYFSQPAPAGALWYKYDPDNGWSVYPQAIFSPDRSAVTLILEDGGMGDQDGVRNGIIVDPAGLGYTQPANTSDTVSSTADGGGGSGCFIETAAMTSDNQGIWALFAGLILVGCLFVAGIRK